jgi:hypothetical protein
MEATIPTPLAALPESARCAPATAALTTTAPEAAPDALSPDPLEIPAPPRERLAWGFPIGCTVVAALAYGVSWFMAPPVLPDVQDAIAPSSFAFTGEPIGEASVLPMPFLTPLPPPSAFLPAASPARVTPGPLAVSGRLPREVVERVLRQSRGGLRRCYEAGLRSNPNLVGRVGVRLVIGRDGGVTTVANGGSDLPDGSVVRCVVGAHQGMAFPAPEGGIVTVVYPVAFSPG